jgi:hypothetical protein
MRLGFRVSVTSALLALVPVLAWPQSSSPAKGTAHQLFVSVVDQGGAPVTGLTVSDFEVREGGASRTVTRVGPAGGTMRIALLVGNGFLSGAAINDMRAGLQAFTEALPEQDEILFATIARQFRLRVPPTADRKKLKDSIGLLFLDTGSGTALIDSLLEADDRFLRKAPDRRPVFVIVTTDGPESSGVRIEVLNQRIHELSQRAATEHAIVLSHPAEGKGNEPEICMSLTRSTGGHYEAIGTTSSLPDRLKALASLILDAHRQAGSQYQIEFLSEAKTPQAIEIAVARSGVKVEVSPRPK